MASLTGPSRTTQHDGLVTVEVPVSGPYGMTLGPGHNGRCGLIKQWDRLPNGKFGPIQVHGGVRLGDYVLRVNDLDVTTLSFKELKAAVIDSNLIHKILTFGSPSKYREILELKMGGKGLGGGAPGRDFTSAVRQARINKDGREPFAEYEIVCKLKLATSKVHKESSLKWSVWHRFSDFLALHNQLTAQLGWQLKDAKFPPKKSVVFNKLNITFIENRRNLLDAYWQQVIVIDRICDFGKHHANDALTDFLDVTHTMATNNAVGGTDVIAQTDDTEKQADSSAPQRRGSTRTAQRRGSLASQRNNKSNPKANRGTNNASPPPQIAAATPTPTATPSAATEIPEEYDRYFKMLKMHLPRAAVEQKMRAEGVDPSILDQYGAGDEAPPSAPPPPKAPAPSRADPIPSAPVSKPPKATGGRANLLADISKHRIE